VIATPCTLKIAGVEVDFLPYTHTPIDHLDQLRATAATRKGQKTLFGHLAVHGAQLNTLHNTHSDVIIEHDGDMVKVDATVFRGWDQTFLGHYHGKQKISDTAEYIGSPLQLCFGEAFQHKQVVLYDLKTGEKEYVLNKFSPQHFIIKEDDVPKYEVENNFIKLAVDDLAATHLVDLRRELEKKAPGSLEIVAVPKQEVEKLIDDCKAIFLKEEEMMERWVDEVGPVPGRIAGTVLSRSRLLEKGNEVCEHQLATQS
jgi:DNA repair exonuclease SbcCD nuclease subunit